MRSTRDSIYWILLYNAFEIIMLVPNRIINLRQILSRWPSVAVVIYLQKCQPDNPCSTFRCLEFRLRTYGLGQNTSPVMLYIAYNVIFIPPFILTRYYIYIVLISQFKSTYSKYLSYLRVTNRCYGQFFRKKIRGLLTFLFYSILSILL